MCVYGHPTDPIFQPQTLTFLIGNYSILLLVKQQKWLSEFCAKIDRAASKN
jgi:hypothetical protein